MAKLFLQHGSPDDSRVTFWSKTDCEVKMACHPKTEVPKHVYDCTRIKANFSATCMHLPQSFTYQHETRAYPAMLQVYRNYSEGAPENSDSKLNAAGSHYSTTADQGSGDMASTAAAESSAQRIKVILKVYGTAAELFIHPCHFVFLACVTSLSASKLNSMIIIILFNT